jgi:hypothetical protein
MIHDLKTKRKLLHESNDKIPKEGPLYKSNSKKIESIVPKNRRKIYIEYSVFLFSKQHVAF